MEICFYCVTYDILKYTKKVSCDCVLYRMSHIFIIFSANIRIHICLYVDTAIEASIFNLQCDSNICTILAIVFVLQIRN